MANGADELLWGLVVRLVWCGIECVLIDIRLVVSILWLSFFVTVYSRGVIEILFGIMLVLGDSLGK